MAYSNRQMCSTPCGIRGTFISISLTIEPPAFGAQRLAASEVLSYELDHGAHDVPTLVLNALRHQRYFHEDYYSDDFADNECSTPCGIRGTFIRLI